MTEAATQLRTCFSAQQQHAARVPRKRSYSVPAVAAADAGCCHVTDQAVDNAVAAEAVHIVYQALPVVSSTCLQ
jgi:hypothetical protein